MCNQNKIKSVAEFISMLSNFGIDDDKTRYFRGHHDQAYKLTPGIYREEYLIKNEDKIIKEAFTSCANDFLPHETLFEKLAKLQHYDYATRLLDISANALVGLYFAVRDFKSKESSEAVDNTKDGEVIVLDIPNESIKYDDSDSVSILSALSLMDFTLFDIGTAKYYANNLTKLEIAFDNEVFNDQKKEIINYFKENEVIKEELVKIRDEMKEKLFFRKMFNSQKNMERLIAVIHQDKPYFLPHIKDDDFNKVLCVKAKPNSPRITRQHGAFLLFGINGRKENMSEVPAEWINKPNGHRLIIDKDSKAKILQELAVLGISSQTLFPELDKQAKPIMDKYRKA